MYANRNRRVNCICAGTQGDVPGAPAIECADIGRIVTSGTTRLQNQRKTAKPHCTIANAASKDLANAKGAFWLLCCIAGLRTRSRQGVT